MKTFKIFSMAAVALCLAACSNSDDYSVQMPTQSADVLHFEAAVAAPNADATMRTVYTEEGGNIKVAWKDGDKIAAIVKNSEDKYVKTELTVSKVNTDGSATISGDITKPNDNVLTVDLIYPADIVTVAANGSDYRISFKKMSNGTLDGTLESIANNIDYRMADDCALTVSGDKATLTSAAKLESKLSIWKLTLQDKVGNALSASKVSIADGAGVMASATLATAGSTAYLPVLAGTGNICISATTADNDYFYMKEGLALAAKKYYQSTVQMTKGAHLAFLSADYEAKDGETLTGTLASNVKISIADPVAPATTTTVTLKDVQINESGTWTSGNYAGITCAGNATINLEGTNTVKGFYEDYPGIYVPSGKTLTIMGSGSLTASSGMNSYGNGYGAGIGGGYTDSNRNCGNIDIKGGNITAIGGREAAGIGGGDEGSCGNITISGGTVEASCGEAGAGIGGGDEGTFGAITISGGTVNATGGKYGAGIGGGNKNGTCGTITITSDVSSVIATKGDLAPNSIGKGDEGQAITVIIGGTVYADGISTSPFEYSPIAATAHELSASVVGDVVDTDGNAYTLDATHVLPSGVTKVAMVAYKSATTGESLAIALADQGHMNWATAKSTCEGKAAIGGNSWKLPTQDDWKNMFKAFGGSDASYSGLNTALATAGGNGNKLQMSDAYWSSSEGDGDNAKDVHLGSGGLAYWYDSSKDSNLQVRACFAF